VDILNLQPTWREIPVSIPADVVTVRQVTSMVAKNLGFSSQKRADAVLVSSELAQNHINCGTIDGRIAIGGMWCGEAALLTLFSVDEGPGIKNLSRAVHDGVSYNNGYGNGLGTVKRLSDDFAICSGDRGVMPCPRNGFRGTMIAASMWWPFQKELVDNGIKFAAITTPSPGERFCGDGVHVKSGRDISRIVLMDALGHGHEAASSLARAHDVLNDLAAEEPLERVIRHLDKALLQHRGMAVVIVRLNAFSGQVDACGIGNIFAYFVDDCMDTPVVCLPGVLGQKINSRKFVHQKFSFNNTVTCLMYSDGLGMDALRRGQIITSCVPLICIYLNFRRPVPREDDASLVIWTCKKR